MSFKGIFEGLIDDIKDTEFFQRINEEYSVDTHRRVEEVVKQFGFEQCKINIPSTYSNYRNHNGEGMWGFEYKRPSYPGYAIGILTNDSIYYPGKFLFGDLVLIRTSILYRNVVECTTDGVYRALSDEFIGFCE